MKRFVYKSGFVSLFLLSLLTTSYGFICMTKNCFASSLVFIVSEGLMTKVQTGAIIAAFWAVYAVMQIVGGVVSDRFDPRFLVAFSMIGAGLCNLAVYFLHGNYLATILIWSLNAALQFAMWPATFKLISTALHPRYREKGLLIATLANPAGTMANFLVAAVITKWQHNFLISAFGLFLLAAVWLIAVACARPYREEVVDPLPARKKVKAVKLPDAPSFPRLLLSSGMPLVFLFSFTRSIVNQMQSLLPVMINESYSDVPPRLATIISITALVGSTIGPILASILRRISKNEMAIMTLFFVAVTPLGLYTLLIGKVSYISIVAALGGIVLCSSAASFYSSTMIAVHFAKWGKDATIAGISNAFSASGIVFTNLAMTWIAEEFGWPGSLITLCALILLSLSLAAINIPIWGRFKKKHNLWEERV